MKPTFIKVDGKEYPVMWNRRAKSNWEKATGVTWIQLSGTINHQGDQYLVDPVPMSIEMAMYICLEALREGYRMDNKRFEMELDDMYQLCDKGLEAEIEPLVFPK